MSRRPIEARVDATGPETPPEGPGVDPDAFREALAHWASTVTVVAVRDGERVHGMTVTSFAPVSARPPLVVISLGAGATVLPFLQPGTRFAVSFLSRGQERIASVLADAYPVGPSPFPAEGDPVVGGCVVALVCAVRSLTETEGGARLVVARVEEVRPGGGGAPLLYHQRGYGSPGG